MPSPRGLMPRIQREARNFLVSLGRPAISLSPRYLGSAGRYRPLGSLSYPIGGESRQEIGAEGEGDDEEPDGVGDVVGGGQAGPGEEHGQDRGEQDAPAGPSRKSLGDGGGRDDQRKNQQHADDLDRLRHGDRQYEH